MDVLKLIRSYTLSKKSIIEQNSFVKFSDDVFDKNAKTNYRIWGTGKDGIPADFYNIGSIMFLLANSKLPHPSYVLAATNASISVIRRPDRRDLLSYINGITDISANIDISAELAETTVLSESIEVETNSNLDNDEVSKKRLKSMIDSSNNTNVLQNSMKESTLTQSIPLGKIAALKAKRLARKRTTISQPETILTTSKSLSLIENHSKIFNKIRTFERIYENRHTVLRSRKKKFTTSVFNILKCIKNRENKQSNTIESVERTNNQSYSRYEQKTHEETEGFKIKTKLTYSGMTLKSVTSGLSSVKPKSRFDVEKVVLPVAKKKVSRTPIIVIPASTNSIITMFNCKSILGDLKYADNLKTDINRPNEIIINRKSSSSTFPYKVIDNVNKLEPDDWSRVIAVFVQGPAWQFKGWPWNGNPVEIFSNLKAFHLKWKELPIDTNIKKWSVEILELDRIKRHLDRALLQQIWKSIDTYLIKYKPNLRF
ncbi:Cell division cycle protein 73 [Intoshia linei]|uniref:Cell division cycle protein 73 n=1 Tax=Intoshia linei TaxID=1819745 RepID=A0A177B8E8_9BILA|nr:Cell division cycle protein 73 [Intoshia linei]